MIEVGFKYAGFSGPHPSLVVPCPTCGSPVGHYCNGDDGTATDSPHWPRRAAAGTTPGPPRYGTPIGDSGFVASTPDDRARWLYDTIRQYQPEVERVLGQEGRDGWSIFKNEPFEQAFLRMVTRLLLDEPLLRELEVAIRSEWQGDDNGDAREPGDILRAIDERRSQR